MRDKLKTTFDLDHLICHDEGDGWGSAEPYMWTIFFKIDGETCRLNESLMLEGTATIYTTPGSHGNLGDTDVDGGDTVSIPSAIGLKEMTLTPISVPDFVKALGTDDVTAIAGCIVVLMEEDNVSDAGAEAGHQALNAGVQTALDNLIPTLGVTNQDISDADIDQMTQAIQSGVESAIQNQQNIFENFWSWLNKDDTIGTKVWKFSGDELLDQDPIALNKRWKNEGDWELKGSISTVPVLTCPAELVEDILDSLFGEKSAKSMKVMREFRDKEMKEKKGLYNWWRIASRNTTYLNLALRNKEAAKEMLSLFKAVPSILENRNQPLEAKHIASLETVLREVLSKNQKDRKSRMEVKRTLAALKKVEGKTPNEIIDFLSAHRPVRKQDRKK